MKTKIACDIAIIGAGAGGLSVAAGAAQFGLKTVLIEQGVMGGDCLNSGCVPSKSLIAAAKRVWQATHSQNLGLNVSEFHVDFKQVFAHVQDVIATIAVHDSEARFESLGAQVIKAQAHFIGKNVIEAGDNIIQAKKIVIATGSTPSVPPIYGLDSIPYFTNESIFHLKEQPEHLLVIGGGPIGCELAQAFAMLGTKVTVLEGQALLNREDSDCAEVVRQSMLHMNITIHEKIAIKALSQKDDKTIEVTIQDNDIEQVITGSHVLVATGRKPTIDALDCDKANVAHTPRGIEVDARMRTSNKKIFALGDVTGQMQFTHVAGAQAGVVLRQVAFHLPAKMNMAYIPRVTYTEPELAHIGLTESECQDQKIDYKILTVPYQDIDRALAEGKTEGFLKLVLSPKGKILGVSIVGQQAGELLPTWEMLMREQGSLRRLTDSIVAYPTLSEINKKAAGLYYAPKLFSPMVRRIVGMLHWL